MFRITEDVPVMQKISRIVARSVVLTDPLEIRDHPVARSFRFEPVLDPGAYREKRTAKDDVERERKRRRNRERERASEIESAAAVGAF